MDTKTKIDFPSKLSDIINKKLIALLTIAGAFGFYGINLLRDSFFAFGITLILAFLFVSVGVCINYLKLIKLENELEGLKHERIYGRTLSTRFHHRRSNSHIGYDVRLEDNKNFLARPR